MKNINFCLCLVVSLCIGNLSYAQSQTGLELDDDEQLIEFTTDRFTLPNLHVTPDKKYIIFDVLGDIYQVPIEGGKAEVLLQDSNWKRGAKLSPDGKTLAYVSDETGKFQVWTYDFETKKKRVYPIIEFIHYPLYSYWDENNQLFIPSESGLYKFDPKTGIGNIIRHERDIEYSNMHTINRRMSMDSPSSNALYYIKNEFWSYDIEKKEDVRIGVPPRKGIITLQKASTSSNNIIYYRDNDSIYTEQELTNWNVMTNKTNTLNHSKKLLYTTNLNYSFDFIDDHTIVLDKEGEVVRMDIDTGDYKPIPIEVAVRKVIKRPLQRTPITIQDNMITAKVLRNPITRPSLDTIYFGAFGKLHAYSKTTGEIKEVYPDKNRFEISPSLSPNGKYLAYTTWNDWEMGHLYVREIQTGKETQITTIPGRYINPTWSPDGLEIVFIADETEAKMGIPKQTPGSNTTNYHLDIRQISVFKNKKLNKKASSVKIKRIHPLSELPRRFYPIPVYHPNGKSIYVTARNHQKDLPALIQIDLNTQKILCKKAIPFNTDEVLISPTGSSIAFIFDDTVWLSNYPHCSVISGKEYPGGDYQVQGIHLKELENIFEIAPSYLYWQDENTLMWGSAEEVYTYDLKTQKTQKIADIKVQKPRAVPKTNYALTNAQIITVNKNDDIIEKGTVLIKNDRIEKVGSTDTINIPENYKVFDLNGKTITPGLIDVHAHYHHGPYEFTNQQEYQYIGNLAFGVTTIYDPSVNVLDYKEQSQMVETGQLLGPRVLASGNIIMNYPIYYDFKKLDTYNDAERLLKSIKKLGVHGPMKEYEIINKKKRERLKSAAKDYDFTITSHQVSFQQSLSRIICGYTAIEHEISDFKIYQDVVKFLAKSKINYTPTLIVRPGIGNIFDTKITLESKKLKRFNNEILIHNKFINRKSKAAEINHNTTKCMDLSNSEIMRASTTVKDIINFGGTISVGGHGNPFPGIGTHMEIWSFTCGGLSNLQAIHTATINGAKKIDLQEEIGSIEKGKLADLIILNSNPLDNIFNTTDLLYTVQNGNVYEAATMKQIYPIRRKLKPWGWDNPITSKSMENNINTNNLLFE